MDFWIEGIAVSFISIFGIFGEIFSKFSIVSVSYKPLLIVFVFFFSFRYFRRSLEEENYQEFVPKCSNAHCKPESKLTFHTFIDKVEGE